MFSLFGNDIKHIVNTKTVLYQHRDTFFMGSRKFGYCLKEETIFSRWLTIAEVQKTCLTLTTLVYVNFLLLIFLF